MSSGHARLCELAAEGDAGYVALLCEDALPVFPPPAAQARNLAGAVGRFVAGGMKRATPEQQAERLAVCRGCPEFRDGRCRVCGCFLSAKIASAAEHCPLDPPKW
jgi:hypothetical protein